VAWPFGRAICDEGNAQSRAPLEGGTMIDINAERQRAIGKILDTEGEEKEAWLKVCGLVLALECCMNYADGDSMELIGADWAMGCISRGELFDDLDNRLCDAVREAVKHE